MKCFQSWIVGYILNMRRHGSLTKMNRAAVGKYEQLWIPSDAGPSRLEGRKAKQT